MNKELLQQALDALKNSTPIPLAADDDYAEGTWKLHLMAINGLEDALAQPVQPQRVPLTDERKQTLIGNYFDDGWARDKAELLIHEVEAAHSIGSEGGA